jgi:chemotaxis protein MotB
LEEKMRTYAIFVTIVSLFLAGGLFWFYSVSGKNEAEAGDLKSKLSGAEGKLALVSDKLAAAEKKLPEIGKYKGELEKTSASKNKLEKENQELQKKLKVSAEEIKEIKKTEESGKKLLSELKSEIEKQQIKISEKDGKISLTFVDKILFPSGFAGLTPEGLAVMDRVGKILKEANDKTIRVEGHTDNQKITGLKHVYPTNWELSTARATTVVRFLQENSGVPPERLEAVGYSEYRPVADNATPEGRSQNRRIEIVLAPVVPGAPKAPAKADASAPVKKGAAAPDEKSVSADAAPAEKLTEPGRLVPEPELDREAIKKLLKQEPAKK